MCNRRRAYTVTYVCHRRGERKEGSSRTRSFSRLVTWPLVGVCLTFSMAVGKERSTAGGLRPPPPATHLPTPSRSPDTKPPTITHASECKLPEAVNHFEKIPDSPRAPSLRVCLAMPLFPLFRPPFPLSFFSSTSSRTAPSSTIVFVSVSRSQGLRKSSNAAWEKAIWLP